MAIVTDREFSWSYGSRRLRRQQTADRVAETEAEGSPLKPQRAERVNWKWLLTLKFTCFQVTHFYRKVVSPKPPQT